MTVRPRDYIMVPVVSVLTMAAMFGAAEIGTRILWPAYEADSACHVGIPNCTFRTKIAEGPWVTYRLNACGYRTDVGCGEKPSGTFRIALLGSSVSEGLNVPQEQTFAARTERALEASMGRPVQVENMGIEGLSMLQCYRKLGEALKLKPDLIVLAISPFDLEPRMDPVQLANRNNPAVEFSSQEKNFARVRVFQVEIRQSRALLIAQHFLFSNPETYLRLYMARGDQADYLRDPISPDWQARFADFDQVLGDMASRTRQARLPLLILVVPSRSQAAMLSVAIRPPHTDPFAFANAIRSLARKHDVKFVDATAEFAATPHAEQLFYAVDAHITSAGHALVAKALAPACIR